MYVCIYFKYMNNTSWNKVPTSSILSVMNVSMYIRMVCISGVSTHLRGLGLQQEGAELGELY